MHPKPSVEHVENTTSAASDTVKKTSLIADLKQSPKVAAYCLALTTGILLYGYDLVIVGNVSSMPNFQYAPRRTYHILSPLNSLSLDTTSAAV